MRWNKSRKVQCAVAAQEMNQMGNANPFSSIEQIPKEGHHRECADDAPFFL